MNSEPAPMLNGVLGPISPSDLGLVLPHEHLYCEIFRATGRLPDILADLDAIIDDVNRFSERGGRTICDVTPPDLGRNPRKLQKISEETGVNVIMGMGRYREPYYEPELWKKSTDQLTYEFIEEIESGVDGVRPGVIGEIGVEGPYISPVEERVHRAAGRAQVATKLPMVTHALFTNVGLLQLDLLAQEGVDLRAVAVSHTDSVLDREYQLEIAARGAFVSIDLIRGVSKRTTQLQVDMTVDLWQAGYGKQILLSQDVCYHALLKAYGGNGYSYVITTFVPLLQDRGLPSEAIDQLLISNPRRWLARGFDHVPSPDNSVGDRKEF